VRSLEARIEALRPELANLARLISSFDETVGALRRETAARADLEVAVANIKLGLRAVLDECRAQVARSHDECMRSLDAVRAEQTRSSRADRAVEELRAELRAARADFGAQVATLAKQRELDLRRVAALEAVVALQEEQLSEQENVWLERLVPSPPAASSRAAADRRGRKR
jgi:chromosome segregation ATPase